MKLVLTQPVIRWEDIDKNFDMIVSASERSTDAIEGSDILVLPELFGATSHGDQYTEHVSRLATTLGCTVVGGSHHERRGQDTVNCGVVCGPDGDILAYYEKQRPYGSEIVREISRGSTWGQFQLDGRNILVLICFDLWFSGSFTQLDPSPDLMLIPSFSVTQRKTPVPAQDLWRHMTVARAHEFAAYVGVSDWASSCAYDGLYSSGVSGLADPRPRDGDFFNPVGSQVFKSYQLDFDRLDQLRENRSTRGF